MARVTVRVSKVIWQDLALVAAERSKSRQALIRGMFEQAVRTAREIRDGAATSTKETVVEMTNE